MAMTDEHKAALAAGRKESRAIKSYLEAVTAPKRRGRPVTAESLEKRIKSLDAKIESEDDPLKRVDLIQTRLDVSKQLSDTGDVDLEALEDGFVACAISYSERKGITYSAWREIGVPASVLKRAGIKQTRNRS